jgi:hypothetical protein
VLKDTSKLLEESTMTTPTRVPKFLYYINNQLHQKIKNIMQKYASALALLDDLILTKYQYQNLQT